MHFRTLPHFFLLILLLHLEMKGETQLSHGRLMLLIIMMMQDLVFSDEKDLSCRMTKVLDRVAHKSPSSCSTLGRLVKYNIPRILRLTDVSSIGHNSSYS